MNLTNLELNALSFIIDFADRDGDAYAWYQSAGATREELAALTRVKNKITKEIRTRRK